MDPHGSDRPHPDPNSGLEEPMWRLGLGGAGGGRSGGESTVYPERPGERDCAYYLRTGTCGYGERCRYNHPIDRGKTAVGAARMVGGEYPERYGQALCEHYLKTGTCRFGSSCKYHHPRQGDGSVQPVPLNLYGYPLRPGEEECSYFMKTGRCKYGLTCKFHHPLPPTSSLPSHAPAFYPASVAAPQQYPEMGGWQFGGSSSALSGAYMPSSYGPIMIPPGVIPLPSWNPYLASLGEAVSSGPPSQSSSSFAPGYPGLYHPVISSSGPSSSAQRERNFPQRPGQHECHYYMKTGECKYGSTCKYHHPLDWRLPVTNYTLSPLGLPLRPVKWANSMNGIRSVPSMCKVVLHSVNSNVFIQRSDFLLLYFCFWADIILRALRPARTTPSTDSANSVRRASSIIRSALLQLTCQLPLIDLGSTILISSPCLPGIKI